MKQFLGTNCISDRKETSYPKRCKHDTKRQPGQKPKGAVNGGDADVELTSVGKILVEHPKKVPIIDVFRGSDIVMIFSI